MVSAQEHLLLNAGHGVVSGYSMLQENFKDAYTI